MTLTTVEYKRNPTTNKLERTGNVEQTGYNKREGGGYEKGVVSVKNAEGVTVSQTAGNLGTSKTVALGKAEEAKAIANTERAKGREELLQEYKQLAARQRQAREATTVQTYQTASQQAPTPQAERSTPSGRISAGETQRTTIEERIATAEKKADLAEGKRPVEAAVERTKGFLLGGVQGFKSLWKAGVAVVTSPPKIVQAVVNDPYIVQKKAKGAVQYIKEKGIYLPIGAELARPSVAGEIVIPAVVTAGASNLISKLVKTTGVLTSEAKIETAVAQSGKTSISTSEGVAAYRVEREVLGVTVKPQEFAVEIRSAGVSLPDASKTIIQSEKGEYLVKEVQVGDLLEQNLKVKNTYSGVGRSETQIRQTPTGTDSKGSFTQVTNTGKEGVQQTGISATKTTTLTQDNSIAETVTESSKPVKVRPQENPMELQYPAKIGKPVEANVGVSATNKLAEWEAPINVNVGEYNGIRITAQTKPVTQSLYESASVSVGGKKVVSKLQGEIVNTRELAVTSTESGVPVVDILKKLGGAREGQALDTVQEVKSVYSVAEAQNLQVIQAKQMVEQLSVSTSQKAIVKGGKVVAVVSAGQRISQQEGQRLSFQRRTSVDVQQPVYYPVPPITKARSVTESVPAVKYGTSSVGKTESQLDNRQRNPFKGRDIVRQDDIQKPRIVIIPGVAFKVGTLQEQQQETQVVQETIQDTRSVQEQQSMQTTKGGFILVPLFRKGSKSSEAGFRVEVKEKGVFTSASPEIYAKGDAMQFGKSRLSNTAAASFRLVKTGDKPTARFSSPRINRQDAFTTSKKDSSVVVQKRGYRISSQGEKQDITFKGIASNKKKRGLF